MSGWDYTAEDPDDIGIAQAHGMLPDDDWTDPAVRCRNGCGWPYAEIVGAKMRTCRAAMVVIEGRDYSDHLRVRHPVDVHGERAQARRAALTPQLNGDRTYAG